MTINCKGELIDLSSPKVMGILNITPDSFYDGGRYKNDKDILQQVETMLSEGATFIDIGAYSSRPGADDVGLDTELSRIAPIVELLIKTFPNILLSIDTFRSPVAKTCIEAGGALVNDISSGQLDNNMMSTVGSLGVPYIMMHMRGNPRTMQENIAYDDIVKDITYFFSEKIAEARTYKINDIILDPGFGFAKNLQQNYKLLNKMELFNMLELPILAGFSRKSMIYKLLNITPDEALNGTSILNTVALQKGACILRVHDVKEAMECIKITNQLH